MVLILAVNQEVTLTHSNAILAMLLAQNALIRLPAILAKLDMNPLAQGSFAKLPAELTSTETLTVCLATVPVTSATIPPIVLLVPLAWSGTH